MVHAALLGNMQLFFFFAGREHATIAVVGSTTNGIRSVQVGDGFRSLWASSSLLI
jgi:hypothetical protein